VTRRASDNIPVVLCHQVNRELHHDQVFLVNLSHLYHRDHLYRLGLPEHMSDFQRLIFNTITRLHVRTDVSRHTTNVAVTRVIKRQSQLRGGFKSKTCELETASHSSVFSVADITSYYHNQYQTSQLLSIKKVSK